MTVVQLVALGGKIWERGDMRRVYFNHKELAAFYGLDRKEMFWYVDGEKVSNNTGHALDSAFREGKFWFYVVTGEFQSRGFASRVFDKLVERITEAAANPADKDEIKAAEPAEAEAVEVTADTTADTSAAADTATVVKDVRTAVGDGIPAHMVRTNRRHGYCRKCGKLVPAGKGRLYYIDPDEAYEHSGWIVEHIECG